MRLKRSVRNKSWWLQSQGRPPMWVPRKVLIWRSVKGRQYMEHWYDPYRGEKIGDRFTYVIGDQPSPRALWMWAI